MENKPLISFVIPTKDRIEWLPEAVMSVLGQTIKEIELIIINDGSVDGTKEFLDEWVAKDPRVRIIHNEKSLGAGISRNLGAKEAQADIIAQFDDDDICIAERAELTINWFKDHPESELVNFPYVSISYFNEITENYPGYEFDEKLFKETGHINYFCNPSCAYRKKSAEEMGGYLSEDMTKTDDIQFVKRWIDYGKKIDFRPGDAVVLHRVLPNSMMSKIRGWDPRWSILKN